MVNLLVKEIHSLLQIYFMIFVCQGKEFKLKIINWKQYMFILFLIIVIILIFIFLSLNHLLISKYYQFMLVIYFEYQLLILIILISCSYINLYYNLYFIMDLFQSLKLMIFLYYQLRINYLNFIKIMNQKIGIVLVNYN